MPPTDADIEVGRDAVLADPPRLPHLHELELIPRDSTGRTGSGERSSRATAKFKHRLRPRAGPGSTC